jgi:hypothetical protein
MVVAGQTATSKGDLANREHGKTRAAERQAKEKKRQRARRRRPEERNDIPTDARSSKSRRRPPNRNAPLQRGCESPIVKRRMT